MLIRTLTASAVVAAGTFSYTQAYAYTGCTPTTKVCSDWNTPGGSTDVCERWVTHLDHTAEAPYVPGTTDLPYYRHFFGDDNVHPTSFPKPRDYTWTRSVDNGACTCQFAEAGGSDRVLLTRFTQPFDVDCDKPCSSEPKFWEIMENFDNALTPSTFGSIQVPTSDGSTARVWFQDYLDKDLDGEPHWVLDYPSNTAQGLKTYSYRAESLVFDHAAKLWWAPQMTQVDGSSCPDPTHDPNKDIYAHIPEVEKCDGYDNNLFKPGTYKLAFENLHQLATHPSRAVDEGIPGCTDGYDASHLWDSTVPVHLINVNVRDGNALYRRADANVEGPYGILSLVRTYDSHDDFSFYSANNSSDNDGLPFGKRWTHSFMVHVSSIPDGRFRVHTGNGQEHYYECMPAVDPGAQQCVPEDPRDVNSALYFDGSDWFWTPGDGTKYEFTHANISGRWHYSRHLTSAGDVISETVLNPNGTLHRVLTADGGKFLQFAYNSDNRITHVSVNGGTDHLVDYDYDSVTGLLQTSFLADAPGLINPNRYEEYEYALDPTGTRRLFRILRPGSSGAPEDATRIVHNAKGQTEKVYMPGNEIAVFDYHDDEAAGEYGTNTEMIVGTDSVEFMHMGSPYILAVAEHGLTNPLPYKMITYNTVGIPICSISNDDVVTMRRMSYTYDPSVAFYGWEETVFNSTVTGCTFEYEDFANNATSTSWKGFQWIDAPATFVRNFDNRRAADSASSTATCDSALDGSLGGDPECAGTRWTYNSNGLVRSRIDGGNHGSSRFQSTVEYRYWGLDTDECEQSNENAGSTGGAYTNKLCLIRHEGTSPSDRRLTRYYWYAGGSGTSNGLLASVRGFVDASNWFDTVLGSYDVQGVPGTVTTPTGVAVSQVRASWGGVTSETLSNVLVNPAGGMLSRTKTRLYDNAGNVASKTFEGLSTDYFRDYSNYSAGRIEGIESRYGSTKMNAARLEYDAAGNLTEVYEMDLYGTSCTSYLCTGPYSSRLSQTFDARGRLVSFNKYITNVVTPDATMTFSYASAGGLSQVEGYDGTIVDVAYDQDRSLSGITVGTGPTAQYSYNATTNMYSVTSPGGESFSNDVSDAMIPSTEDRPHGVRTLEVDDLGRITRTFEQAHGDVCRKYDWFDRLIELDYACDSSPEVTYTYDEAHSFCGEGSADANKGKLTTIEGQDTVEKRCYHPNGSLLAFYRTDDSTWDAASARGEMYYYSTDGKMTHRIMNAFPNDLSMSREVEYKFDGTIRDRVALIRVRNHGGVWVNLTDPASPPTYDRQGNLKTITLANGLEIRNYYDLAGQLTERRMCVATSSNDCIVDIELERDLNGRITRYDDEGLSWIDRWFQYDEKGRLRVWGHDPTEVAAADSEASPAWSSDLLEEVFNLNPDNARESEFYDNRLDSTFGHTTPSVLSINSLAGNFVTEYDKGPVKWWAASVTPGKISTLFHADSTGTLIEDYAFTYGSGLKQDFIEGIKHNGAGNCYRYTPGGKLAMQMEFNGGCASEATSYLFQRSTSASLGQRTGPQGDLTQFIWMGTQPLVMISDAGRTQGTNAPNPDLGAFIYWYGTDPQGTPIVLTDEAGEDVWHWFKDPFGRVESQEGHIEQESIVGNNSGNNSYPTCCCPSGNCFSTTNSCMPSNCLSGLNAWTYAYVSPHANTAKVRVSFRAFELEPGDYVEIQDAGGNTVQVIEGHQVLGYGNQRYWTDWVDGDTVKVVLVSDENGNSAEGVFMAYAQALIDDGVEQPLRMAGQVDTYAPYRMFYNGARWYLPAFGIMNMEDPAGLSGKDWSLFAYAGADPVNNVDPSGLAPCYVTRVERDLFGNLVEVVSEQECEEGSSADGDGGAVEVRLIDPAYERSWDVYEGLITSTGNVAQGRDVQYAGIGGVADAIEHLFPWPKDEQDPERGCDLQLAFCQACCHSMSGGDAAALQYCLGECREEYKLCKRGPEKYMRFTFNPRAMCWPRRGPGLYKKWVQKSLEERQKELESKRILDVAAGATAAGVAARGIAPFLSGGSATGSGGAASVSGASQAAGAAARSAGGLFFFTIMIEETIEEMTRQDDRL